MVIYQPVSKSTSLKEYAQECYDILINQNIDRFFTVGIMNNGINIYIQPSRFDDTNSFIHNLNKVVPYHPNFKLNYVLTSKFKPCKI